MAFLAMSEVYGAGLFNVRSAEASDALVPQASGPRAWPDS